MPSFQKIKSSRVNNASANVYIGNPGQMFYNSATGALRLSDGVTPGGQPVTVAIVGNVTFGNISVTDTTISTMNPNADLILASNGTGNVQVVGQFDIHTTSQNPITDPPIFSIDSTGFTRINAPVISANAAGALNIVGSTGGSYQPVTNAGGMLHITGNDGSSSRITNDAFGTGVSPVYVGRAARGTAASPTVSQSGDVLTRFTGVGWTGTAFGNASASPVATLRIDGVAGENFTGNTLGSYWKIYTNPIGTVNAVLSANIGANATSFPGNVSAANLISGGLTISNNAIYSTLTDVDIVIGQLAANANVVINRTTTHNRDIRVNGNISVSGNISGHYTHALRDAGTIADGGTVTLDFTTDDIVVCVWNNGLNVAYTNLIPGRSVRLIAQKGDGSGTDTLSLDGISANHSSSGSTTISGTAGQSYILEFYSTNTSVAGLYVKV